MNSKRDDCGVTKAHGSQRASGGEKNCGVPFWTKPEAFHISLPPASSLHWFCWCCQCVRGLASTVVQAACWGSDCALPGPAFLVVARSSAATAVMASSSRPRTAGSSRHVSDTDDMRHLVATLDLSPGARLDALTHTPAGKRFQDWADAFHDAAQHTHNEGANAFAGQLDEQLDPDAAALSPKRSGRSSARRPPSRSRVDFTSVRGLKEGLHRVSKPPRLFDPESTWKPGEIEASKAGIGVGGRAAPQLYAVPQKVEKRKPYSLPPVITNRARRGPGAYYEADAHVQVTPSTSPAATTPSSRPRSALRTRKEHPEVDEHPLYDHPDAQLPTGALVLSNRTAATSPPPASIGSRPVILPEMVHSPSIVKRIAGRAIPGHR